jgi:hypothetical protein
MNDLLSILKNNGKKNSNDLFQFLEFFGTPGSGKTYLSNLLYKQLSKDGVRGVNRLPVDVGNMGAIKRIFIKIVIIFYLLIASPSIALGIVKLVSGFHSKNDRIFLKLAFNLLYVIGAMQFCKKYNQIVIIDQGIFQAVWSCIFHGNKKDFNFDKILSILLMILSKVKITNLIVVRVSATDDNIKIRLKIRKIKGNSLLNTGDKKMIEKGIKTTTKTKEFLDYAAKNTSLFSITDFNN